jgi:hypothetical protein
LEAVSSGTLLEYIRDMKLEETFPRFWGKVVKLFGSMVKKTTCEGELRLLIKHKPSPSGLAPVMLKIRNICRKVASEEEDPAMRIPKMISESLSWARKLIRTHYIHYLQIIEMMYHDERGRIRGIKKLGTSYGIEEPVDNDFDIYMSIACNHILSFSFGDDPDRDAQHLRSRVHSSKVEEQEDASEHDVEVNIAETNADQPRGRRDKSRDRSKSRDRRRDQNQSRSKSRDKRDRPSQTQRPPVSGNEAFVTQQPFPGQNNQNHNGYRNPRPQTVGFPQGHPAMLPSGYAAQGLRANRPPWQGNFQPRPSGQGNYQAGNYQGYRHNIRIVSDPNKHCLACNLRGHDYTTCFRYLGNPPGTIQCQNCLGYHQGNCLRGIPMKDMQSYQQQAPAVNANQGQPGRIPVNQGLANQGRQAMPADQAGIQQKNQMRNPAPVQANNLQAGAVYIEAAYADIVEEGSGYGYFIDPSGHQLEEQFSHQISNEELAEIQEAEGFQHEAESSFGDGSVVHQLEGDQQ